MSVALVEKMVGAAVLVTAIIVGIMTMRHGETSLGMLVLLGQIQSLFGSHVHGVADEATHIVVHKQI